MKKIEVEVFPDNSEILSSKICTLRNLLPPKVQFASRKSVSCYPPNIDYSKCSAQEILRKQIAWLDDSRSQRIFLSVEGKIAEVEFINMLRIAGFAIIQEINN